jgi:hypothetical protein
MTYAPPLRLIRLLPPLVLALGSAAGCDQPVVPGHDAGPDAAFQLPDGSVPCTTTADCDDHIGCTNDTCLPGVMICGHTADHARCDDGIFCNGTEMCDFTMDCVSVTAHETCDDGNVCTLDRCLETSRMCEHLPRDLDEDGDPDFNCAGGTDCDDRDPTVSGHAPELCADTIDNDCDDMIDEATCGRAEHDACDDPLLITTSGITELMVASATADYTSSCGSTRPDIVLSMTLTEAHDVTITGESPFDTVTLFLRSDCTAAASEIDCDSNYPGTLRRRAMPAGTYFVIVQSGGNVTLDVELTDPTTPPTNETCAAPILIPPTGGHYTGNFVDTTDDVSISCNFGSAADLVYQIDLPTESDLTVTLSSPMSRYMYWSLRSACTTTSSELRCEGGAPADGTLHQLPAGTYFIVIEGPSSEEVDYSLTVGVSASSPAVHGDTCTDPIPLTLGVPYVGTMSGSEDDINTNCGYFYRDVVHSFTLTETSDLVIEVDAGNAYVNASLRSSCGDRSSELRCVTSSTSSTGMVVPLASHMRAVPAGDYFIVLEGFRAGAYTATVRATTPPTVPMPATGNPNCASPTVIPEATGGYWTGTTVGMGNDYSAVTCGISGLTPTAPDVVFRLDLSAPARVFATTEGSAFTTVLYRYTATCHTSPESACNAFSGPGGTGQLVESLDRGTYFYVVDGFDAAAGNYEFQIFITPT